MRKVSYHSKTLLHKSQARMICEASFKKTRETMNALTIAVIHYFS